MWQWVGVHTDITENKQAEEKIKQSERQYNNLIFSSPSAIGLLQGEELIITTANEPIIEIWGKGKEIIGKKYFEALPELVEQGYKEIFDHVYKTGIPFTAIETPVTILQNGQETSRYYNFILYPQRNTNDEVNGIGIIATDVTSQALLNKTLKQSEKRFSDMVEQAPVAICVLRGEKLIVELANERQLQLWSKTKEQVLNIPIFEGIPEAAGQGFEELLSSVFKTGKSLIANESPITLIRNNKAETIYVNFVYEPLYKNDQIDAIISITTDVTEQVIAKKEIEESERRFRSLAQTLPQLIWVTDAKGNMEFASNTWKEYSGVEPDGEKQWKAIVHPEDYENINATWTHCLVTGNIYTSDVRLKNKDGQYRWHTAVGKHIYDNENNIVKWVGAFTDTHKEKTFIHELEHKVIERTKELAQNNRDLKKMNKELESFAYISSHDLQEPLRKIQMFATRIIEKEQDALSHEGKHLFNRMQNAAERMQQLINDLLAYSRTTTSEQIFKKTDLNKILEDVKEDLQQNITDKAALLEHGQLCSIDIIPFQFRQLLHNLIGNALKFSKTDRQPHVKIATQIAKGCTFDNEKLLPQNYYCCIAVSDNGIGFDPQFKEKIFNVFQRLHTQTEYEGTGIGLSIVKRIVENHNGIITASGEQNKGATFKIYIPTTSQT